MDTHTRKRWMDTRVPFRSFHTRVSVNFMRYFQLCLGNKNVWTTQSRTCARWRLPWRSLVTASVSAYFLQRTTTAYKRGRKWTTVAPSRLLFISPSPCPSLSPSLFLYFFFFSFHVRDVKNQTTLFPPSLSFISGTGRVACGGQGRVLTSRRQCPRTCTPFDTDIIDETIVSHSASLFPRSLFESERNYGKGDETKDWWKWCGFSILEIYCFGVSPLFDCRLIDI